MIEGIDNHWVWLIAAAVLGIAEMIIPGVFLIWLAAAAAITGVVTLIFGFALGFQFGLFAVLALAATTIGRRWYRDNPVESEDPLLNDRAARLVGQTVLVVGAIENGRGRVAVGDSVWQARGPDAEIGARVTVMGAEGSCLKVEPAA
jgi:membrane protein implicated in regulation of membrane protease activity